MSDNDIIEYMENFKSSVSKPLEMQGLSKIIKLLTLVVGMGAASSAFSQEKVSNMEQLIKDTKMYETELSQKVAEKGVIGNINSSPSAEISDALRISKVIYKDNKRNEATYYLVGKGNVYYIDKDADGKLDLVYIDKNEKPSQAEEGAMDAMLANREITQTELDLSNMEGMKKFVCFNLSESKVYDTKDQSISNIPADLKEKMDKTLQEKYIDVLKSNLENIK